MSNVKIKVYVSFLATLSSLHWIQAVLFWYLMSCIFDSDEVRQRTGAAGSGNGTSTASATPGNVVANPHKYYGDDVIHGHTYVCLLKICSWCVIHIHIHVYYSGGASINGTNYQPHGTVDSKCRPWNYVVALASVAAVGVFVLCILQSQG